MSKRSNPTKREHWSQVINSQKTSGLSRRAFCNREGTNYNQLLYWLKSIPEQARLPDQRPLAVCLHTAPYPSIRMDALPLYRQEQIFTRLGVEIKRATIASWTIRMGQMLTPLINIMQEQILSGSVLFMDETSVQVLKGTGKRPQTKNYMWIIHAGPPGKKATVFIYDPSRSKLVPERVLADFCGYLMVDGYKAYDSVSLQKDIIRLGCWAHVPRKFDEAEKTAIGGKASTQRQSAATKAKLLIANLYEIEENAKDLSDDERLSIRQQLSKPNVDEFFEYIHSMLSKVPPKSLLGKALNYAASNQHLLVRFLDNPILPLDNNAAENAIRPFAVGRKHWLFADTVKGADASANIYSVIESAKLAGHEPYFYLRILMEELPKARTLADLEALLPYNVKPLDRGVFLGIDDLGPVFALCWVGSLAHCHSCVGYRSETSQVKGWF
jgi:transposase